MDVSMGRVLTDARPAVYLMCCYVVLWFHDGAVNVNASGVCQGRAYEFYITEFSACNVTCGVGISMRNVSCLDAAGNAVTDMTLCGAPVPRSSRPCDNGPCDSFAWSYSNFSSCSASCGGTGFAFAPFRALTLPRFARLPVPALLCFPLSC